MEALSPDKVEGYREAVSRESIIRDAAFLSQPETVAGYELRQMKLRHYLLLRLTACPLLYEGTPSPEQLRQFLWIMSTSYPVGIGEFFERCKRDFFPPEKPLIHFPRSMVKWERKTERAVERGAEVLKAVHEYISDTMQDRPKAKGGLKAKDFKSYYSIACYWCYLVAKETGWSLDSILDMDLKVLFQFLRASLEEKKVELTNPSDAIVAASRARALSEMNAALKK